MSDYGTYSLQGFWFQPDPVALKDADLYGNNGYLEKYWNVGSGSNAGDFQPVYNMFENYYNMGTYYDNTYSYDAIIDNFKKQTGQTGSSDSSQSSSWYDPYFNFDYDFGSNEPSYDSSMFDPYYNIGGSSYGGTASGTYNSRDDAIEELKNQLEYYTVDESCIKLDGPSDFDSYFNSIFS